MGKEGGCFSAVKRVFSSENKKKVKQNHKSRKWFRKQKSGDLDFLSAQMTTIDPAPAPPIEDLRLMEADNEQNKHACASLAVSVATPPEVVGLTAVARDSGKSREEIAAIKIQKAFRGYMARRALKALRGLVRLKTVIQGQSVKRQVTSTLRYMQTLARVQSQIHGGRTRMLEENLAIQKKLQQKHENEQEKLRSSQSGDDWNDSTQSREKVEANLQSKHEAAMGRERALAYAYTHQKTLRHPSRATNQTFMDPSNPQWGWSWLERWMASRPWEDKSAFDKELNIQDTAKVPTNNATSAVDLSRRDVQLGNGPPPTAHKQSRLPSRQSPSTPRLKTGRITTASPRRSHVDDEKNDTPEKGTRNSAKKRLSFSTSPRGPRRHSDHQR